MCAGRRHVLSLPKEGGFRGDRGMFKRQTGFACQTAALRDRSLSDKKSIALTLQLTLLPGWPCARPTCAAGNVRTPKGEASEATGGCLGPRLGTPPVARSSSLLKEAYAPTRNYFLGIGLARVPLVLLELCARRRGRLPRRQGDVQKADRSLRSLSDKKHLALTHQLPLLLFSLELRTLEL